MQNLFLGFILICALSLLTQNCKRAQRPKETEPITTAETVAKIEMNLSHLGVESAGYPNIKAIVDLKNDTSYCQVNYEDPNFRDTTYRLTENEMDSVRLLVDHYDLTTLETQYKIPYTDQPTSTNTFYVGDNTIVIKDYGVAEGNFPLKGLYHLVYKF